MTPVLKAQTSIEYLAVAALTLALFTPILYFAFSSLQENTGEVAISRVQNTADRLRDEVNTVCPLPTGSKKRVSVTLPGQVDLDSSGFGEIQSHTIHFSVRTEQRRENVTVVADCAVNGSMPTTSGSVFLIVERTTGNVTITPESQAN